MKSRAFRTGQIFLFTMLFVLLSGLTTGLVAFDSCYDRYVSGQRRVVQDYEQCRMEGAYRITVWGVGNCEMKAYSDSLQVSAEYVSCMGVETVLRTTRGGN